ncbi:MAG: hypothetical protein RL217_1575 [Pseudomonadota bacterium]|jgi:thiamine kinase
MHPKLPDILTQWPNWGLCKKAINATHISALKGGLTNVCYLLTLDLGQYVLRISANADALGIDRDSEYRLQQMLAEKDLAPSIRYRESENQYWLRDYVKGEALSPADLTLENLQKMAQHLQKVHCLKLNFALNKIDITQKAERYWQTFLPQSDQAFLALKAYFQHHLAKDPVGELCLCHMDPTAANWIASEQGLVLLDWEYAALGHPLWDVAGLIQQANLSLKEEGQILTQLGYAQDANWYRAKAQLRYLEVLWYRAQNLSNDAKLHTALGALKAYCDTRLDLY